MGDLIADQPEPLDVLNRAREIPIRLHLIGDLVIAFRAVLTPFLVAVFRRFPPVVGTGSGEDSRYAGPGKLNLVGKEKVRAAVGGLGDECPLLRGRGFGQNGVQRGQAVPEIAGVARPAPEIAVVQVDVGERAGEWEKRTELCT